MPWKDMFRVFMTATALIRGSAAGNIPCGPVSRGKDTAWRGSANCDSRATRSNRTKARRKSRAKGE